HRCVAVRLVEARNRLVAAPSVQCNQEVVTAAFISLSQRYLVTERSEDAGPPKRRYTIAGRGTRRSWSNDEYFHVQASSLQIVTGSSPVGCGAQKGNLRHLASVWLTMTRRRANWRLAPLLLESPPLHRALSARDRS